MSPLPPPPPSAKPPMPQQRRKTSLRTVPKQVQQQFKERLAALAEDPLRVLPEVVGPTPRELQRVRAGLERVATGKAGFLLRRDKGIVGAVRTTLAMKDKPAPTRMLDIQVGGSRRFFTVRGQVERAAMAGVQNHDHPPSLLMAYRTMAKAEGLHFFAGPGFWCTGTAPAPPDRWVEALADRAGIDLEAADGGWTCGHSGGQVVLGFRGGPEIRVCSACGKQAGNLHKLLSSRYAGPRQRQPLEVRVRAPDGQVVDVAREQAAEYRAGVVHEGALLRTALQDWKPEGRVWMQDGTIHDSLEAWLDALGAHPWEREALAAMAADGYKGAGGSVADVLDDLRGSLRAGVAAILGSGMDAFLAEHQGQALRDQLRAAHEEAVRRERTADIPRPRTGPIGRFLDEVTRAQAAGGRKEALAVVRKAIDTQRVPGLHIASALGGLGGDVSLESRLSAGDREAGRSLSDDARRVLESRDAGYLEALAAYLRESGSGERVDT